MKRKKIMVSGGFDPVHVGHIRMIQEAAQWGDVIVVISGVCTLLPSYVWL